MTRDDDTASCFRVVRATLEREESGVRLLRRCLDTNQLRLRRINFAPRQLHNRNAFADLQEPRARSGVTPLLYIDRVTRASCGARVVGERATSPRVHTKKIDNCRDKCLAKIRKSRMSWERSLREAIEAGEKREETEKKKRKKKKTILPRDNIPDIGQTRKNG